MNTTATANAPTRLSLYKLLLETTIWVEISPAEYRRILRWLEQNRSQTSRRNAVDNLFETFVWFPTLADGRVWIPLGHLTRLFVQIEERTPAFASEQHPNVVMRDSLQRNRAELNGGQILDLRLAQITREAGQ